MTYVGNVAAALALAAIAAVLWLLRSVLLLVFAGILFAVALAALARPVSRRLHVSWRSAVVFCVVLVSGAVGALAAWTGTALSAQVAQLGQQLPQALAAVRAWLGDLPFGSDLLADLKRVADGGLPFGEVASGAAVAVSAVGKLVLVLLLAVFLCAQPNLYRSGAVRLLPPRHRGAVAAALDACAEALDGWLKGQAISMSFVGLATAVGLWFLGVPLALLLGVLAALLDFVPFFGPIASGGLAVLLAFVQGPHTAVYVALLALCIQQIEGNLLVPLVQRWAVHLPPAVGLVAVVVAATIFGLPGIVLATPLMVVAMVLVRKLYVESALESGERSRSD